MKRNAHAARRGTAVVMAAVLLTMLLMLVALAVDGGYLYATKANLQAVADSAALAGASALGTSDPSVAIKRAKAYALANKINGGGVALKDSDVQVEVGTWDGKSRTFTSKTPASGVPLTAIRVIPGFTGTNSLRLFFAGLMGFDQASVRASATATQGACDVIVVLDFSASMCYDSQLRTKTIESLGSRAVENMLTQIYRDIGSPIYGNLSLTPQKITSTNDSTILQQLGLTKVTYPYPNGGSWSEYFSYVRRDKDAGPTGWGMDESYQYQYSYMTFMSYLQAWQCQANQVPDLWKTQEQPVSSVKDGLSVFLAYLQEGGQDDRVGLVIFDSARHGAVLEQPLTKDFDLIQDTANHRQAGHYDRWTNTAAGLSTALAELQAHGRDGVFKMIILLSDGLPDILEGGTGNDSLAKPAALNVAHTIGNAHIPVVPISLGALADTQFMQDVADITQNVGTGQGVHFIIPGGQPVEQYREELMETFAKLAVQIPMAIVD